MEILDGKKTSAQVREELRREVEQIVSAGHRPPHLVAILVGDNGASITYVNAKVKACQEIGFRSSLIKYPAEVSQGELLDKIDELNNDPTVDGFIVQLPLPAHIDEKLVTERIRPEKVEFGERYPDKLKYRKFPEEALYELRQLARHQIGRASCRERV